MLELVLELPQPFYNGLALVPFVFIIAVYNDTVDVVNCPCLI